MCDLNWCPVCDCAIDCQSDSLYCSFTCYQQDLKQHVAKHHPELKQSFLLPKQPVTVIPIKSYDPSSVPDLASSLSTTSSISNLSSKKSISKRLWLFDDPETEDCCLYCEKKQQPNSFHCIPV